MENSTCTICGIGEMINEKCNFCQQKKPAEISEINLDILANKLISAVGRYGFIEHLFIPEFVAKKLLEPEVMAKFKKKLPDGIAKRLFLSNVYELAGFTQPCSYNISLWA